MTLRKRPDSTSPVALTAVSLEDRGPTVSPGTARSSGESSRRGYGRKPLIVKGAYLLAFGSASLFFQSCPPGRKTPSPPDFR